MASEYFNQSNYKVCKQIFKLFGGTFRIFDSTGNLAFYTEMKAFKLKEDLTVYTSEDKSIPLLNIKARSIIDFSATYDVVDQTTQEKVGALRRKGLKSLFRDEWIILDSLDQEIGYIKEDNHLLAFLRRLMSEFLPNLIPQSFHGEMRGFPVCAFKQNFNPFVLKLDLDFTPDVNNMLDRRLGIAAAVVMCAIEGKQQ